MAKTGVKSNITPAMRKFERGFLDMLKETGNKAGALSSLAMDDIRTKGLIKGELEKDSKRQYADIRQNIAGVIEQRRPSQKGKTKDKQRYKHYGKIYKRRNRYAPRDRGPRAIKRVFHKSRIAVRTGNFVKMFEHKTNYNRIGDKLVQTRRGALIEIQNFDEKKNKTSQMISFSFLGNEGKSLRMLSYGRRRKVPITLENGKSLKGRKGKRDITRFVRGTFRKWNKAIELDVLSNYKKEFKKIK